MAKWTNVQDPGIFENIYGMKFLNKDTGFVAGWSRYASIMKTTNGGENWDKRDSLPYQLFSINTLDGESVYAAGSSLIRECGLLLISTDKGQNWIPDFFDGNLRPFCYGFYDIEILNNQTFLMCGYFGTIVKTTNGGINWDTMHTGVNNEVFTLLNFVDENIGYTTSFKGFDYENVRKIYKTTDGGNNWFVIKEPDSLLRIGTIKFFNADVGYLVGKYNTSAIVLKTVDGGLNWTSNYSGRSNFMLLTFDYINENIIIAAGEHGYVIKTTDGGQSWFEENTGTGENYLIAECIDEFYGYLGATKGMIMKYNLFNDINEIDEISAINMYPNPVGDYSYFKLENINYSSYNLKIYDIRGNEKITKSGISGDMIDINLQMFGPGMYIYCLALDNQKYFTGKFIKF
jgi:photosystem II stability/assembly factor-like uncharacterized protein